MKTQRALQRGLWVLVTFVWAGTSSAQVSPGFIRGDSNSNGDVDISDAIHLLDFLFAGGNAPRCIATADANASGDLDISDAISLLSYLFLGEASLPPLSAAEEVSCVEPWVVRSGRFVTEMHGVTGIAEHLSDRTIRLREFHYDGEGGQGVYIWLHTGGDLRRGKGIGSDLQNGFPGYTNATIVAPIPDSIRDDEFHSVAIWCTTFDLLFGNARLDG